MNKKFTKYWSKVASYFKGNKYVIAYELINEEETVVVRILSAD